MRKLNAKEALEGLLSVREEVGVNSDFHSCDCHSEVEKIPLTNIKWAKVASNFPDHNDTSTCALFKVGKKFYTLDIWQDYTGHGWGCGTTVGVVDSEEEAWRDHMTVPTREDLGYRPLEQGFKDIEKDICSLCKRAF